MSASPMRVPIAGPRVGSSRTILRSSSAKGSTRFSRNAWSPALSMVSGPVAAFGSSATARLLRARGVGYGGRRAAAARAGSAADLHGVPHLGQRLLAVLVVLGHRGQQRGVL